MATSSAQAAAPLSGDATASPLAMSIILSCALAHLINDLIQAVLPAIYPLIKAEYGLTFTQVGLITLTFQATASLLQPWIGLYTDRHPKPFLLPTGAVCTLIGILLLSAVDTFPSILIAAALIGIGSSTFHPETSRVARLASGGALAWLNRHSKSAETQARLSDPYWQPPSSFPLARATFCGLACSGCLPSVCNTG